MLKVVRPFDHRYCANPAGADNITLPPTQNVVAPTDSIMGCGGIASLRNVKVTGLEASPTHPLAVTDATTYVPAVDTCMVEVVAPLDQRNESPDPE